MTCVALAMLATLLFLVLVCSLRFMVEASERGVALWSHAFEDHRELCDAVQRVYGNAGEADDGPLTRFRVTQS